MVPSSIPSSTKGYPAFSLIFGGRNRARSASFEASAMNTQLVLRNLPRLIHSPGC